MIYLTNQFSILENWAKSGHWVRLVCASLLHWAISVPAMLGKDALSRYGVVAICKAMWNRVKWTLAPTLKLDWGKSDRLGKERGSEWGRVREGGEREEGRDGTRKRNEEEMDGIRGIRGIREYFATLRHLHYNLLVDKNASNCWKDHRCPCHLMNVFLNTRCHFKSSNTHKSISNTIEKGRPCWI